MWKTAKDNISNSFLIFNFDHLHFGKPPYDWSVFWTGNLLSGGQTVVNNKDRWWKKSFGDVRVTVRLWWLRVTCTFHRKMDVENQEIPFI